MASTLTKEDYTRQPVPQGLGVFHSDGQQLRPIAGVYVAFVLTHPDPSLPFVPICAGPCLLLLPETGLCVQTGRAGSSENAHGLATVTSVSHTSSLEAPSFQDRSDTRAEQGQPAPTTWTTTWSGTTKPREPKYTT